MNTSLLSGQLVDSADSKIEIYLVFPRKFNFWLPFMREARRIRGESLFVHQLDNYDQSGSEVRNA